MTKRLFIEGHVIKFQLRQPLTSIKRHTFKSKKTEKEDLSNLTADN